MNARSAGPARRPDGQASAGDLKGARESFRRASGLLKKLPENERRLQAHNLVSAQGEAGDHEGAKETAAAVRPAAGSDTVRAMKVVVTHAYGNRAIVVRGSAAVTRTIGELPCKVGRPQI